MNDPTLALLGPLDLPVLIGIAILAGVLRQIEGLPRTIAITFPTLTGCLLGALGAWGGAAYAVASAAIITGAGATVVGRMVAAAVEPKPKDDR